MPCTHQNQSWIERAQAVTGYFIFIDRATDLSTTCRGPQAPEVRKRQPDTKKIPLLTTVGKGVFCFVLERTYRRVSVFLKYQGVGLRQDGMK
ncbi:hypothetical protein A6D6_04086 [Alcanivorax xiamenensis]|uniref:Uncharacterized protein n=1 Tax=Alcanivorax xiamenensis TaxID=1177156 RepID=A0ABQ6Y2J0_9GAMM|nr:hypothetical protein A6D6_04086 [Alcanivorax xiamenensis]